MISDYDNDNDYVIEVDKLSIVDALRHCLSTQVKSGDAPCSASTHLNAAIIALYELVPDYEPWSEESKDALKWAIDEGRILRGEE